VYVTHIPEGAALRRTRGPIEAYHESRVRLAAELMLPDFGVGPARALGLG
jgi:hypothetical protein